ncbi:MAG: YhbY family RNA-binding protein [Candidatus Fimadaptatus sp.]
MTSKQRAALRSMANTMPTILYIGKGGITKEVCQQAWDALEARELIKVGLQDGAPMSVREACDELCGQVHAEPVQCIGKRFVMYRPARKPVIDLDEIVRR